MKKKTITVWVVFQRFDLTIISIIIIIAIIIIIITPCAFSSYTVTASERYALITFQARDVTVTRERPRSEILFLDYTTYVIPVSAYT